MKWLIASDIHGDAAACEALFRAFGSEHADKLLLLGDLLYHGPRNDVPAHYAPKRVIEMLNEHKNRIFTVRGNCEAEVDQMVLDFPVLAEYAMMEIGSRLMFVTHGHLFSPEKMPQLCPNDIFLFGHTHIPQCKTVNGILCLNPGSCAIPKENSPAGYITLEDGTLIWKDMSHQEYMRHTL